MHPFPPGTTLHNPVTHEWGRLLRLDEREMVAELICAPGGGVAVPHRHPHQEERFEVLAGALAVTLEGEPVTFGPGEVATVAPGRAHRWVAAGDEDLHARVTVTPPGRFVEMIGAAWGLCATGRSRADGAPGLLDGILLAEAFGEDMVLVSPPAWVQRVMVRVVAPLLRATGRRVDDPPVLDAACVDPTCGRGRRVPSGSSPPSGGSLGRCASSPSRPPPSCWRAPWRRRH